MHHNRALVVTDDVDARDFWTASLELAGYDTHTCPGPGEASDCPRLHGVRCVQREVAEVAVVDLDCDEDASVCAKVPDDGGTVFVRRLDASRTPRGELLHAVEDARRHVEDLHSAPLQSETIWALDLD